ncbi:hypothetical protein D7294_22390 [Streptomyces hoynatensis]|uniref:Endonuclease V n=1 Tax=Streptomyces hoynatensis TaxID=1141874 RepID=A0A3A9YSJ7_9ACTN|nr:endonuclease V [Streptomyces hoynatensis]RKN38945.1 hypothetical protein D7294_22390 [Streptomyces hoynatensis]
MALRVLHPHTTPAGEAEAIAVQEELRERVLLDGSGPAPGAPGTVVVGVDVAYDEARDLVAAAAVALEAPGLTVVEQATAVGRVSFPYVAPTCPYVPGLPAFRELPAVLDALGRLTVPVDLVVCDGHGLAHRYRLPETTRHADRLCRQAPREA